MDYSNWNTALFTDGSRVCIKVITMVEERGTYMDSGKETLVFTG